MINPLIYGLITGLIKPLIGSGGDSACNVYLFSSANSDSLEIESFTGNLKVMIAAPSEAGINPAIIAGRQGDFVASADPVNEPTVVQYEINATNVTQIVDNTFNGVVYGYAKDNTWYKVDMGSDSVPLISPFSKIVTMGDSITNHLFAYDYRINNAKRYVFNTQGVNIEIQNEAVSGSITSETLAKLPSVLSSVSGESGVLFYINCGFNDVSALKPYSTATSEQLTQLDSDYREIITTIKSAGHQVVLGSVHFATYGNQSAYDNEDQLTKPFNDNIFLPAINDLSPESVVDGVPIIDMYTLDWNDFEATNADGIHHKNMGIRYQAWWILDRLFSATKGRALQPLIKEADPRLKEYKPERILIALDDDDTSTVPTPAIRGWNSFERIIGGKAILLDVEGNPSKITFTQDGEQTGTNGYALDPLEMPTLDITTDSAVKHSWYTSSALTILMTGFDANQSVYLNMVSSRSNNTPYATDIDVNGVTKTTLSGSTSQIYQVSFDAAANNDGEILITVTPAAGSSLGYINAIEIVPQWA